MITLLTYGTNPIVIAALVVLWCGLRKSIRPALFVIGLFLIVWGYEGFYNPVSMSVMDTGKCLFLWIAGVGFASFGLFGKGL